MNKAKILLAEDDTALSFVINDGLQEAGFEVVLCKDGEAAWQKFTKQEFDICLLDINMPVRDGFSLAKKIRQKSDIVPIIFLTAKSQEEDKIKGFETGADDYITKPFSLKELVLRIEVFLRRTRKIQSNTSEEYHLGNLNFAYNQLTIYGENYTATLTQREADLLKFFVTHINKVLKREELLLNVWGKDDYFLGRSMDVFIARLRKYLKPEPKIELETLHGVGFRLLLK